MLVGVPMTKDQIIEKGMDVMVQLIKFDVEQNDIQTTLRLNVLGVIYGATMPTSETNDPKNIEDCWKQIAEQFGVMHIMGQKYNIQHGSRELTEQEQQMLEEKK